MDIRTAARRESGQAACPTGTPGPRRRWRVATAGGMAAAVLLLAACSSNSSSSTTTTSSQAAAGSSTAVVDSATVGTHGKVLVTSTGATLYRYAPDGTGPSTCSGDCASAWPALTVPAGTSTVSAGSGVTAADLGTVARPDGSLQ